MTSEILRSVNLTFQLYRRLQILVKNRTSDLVYANISTYARIPQEAHQILVGLEVRKVNLAAATPPCQKNAT
ncbi:unnamed protein product [Cylicocyclus nassatus]|uniref:Uncharacterized protein n=1 Tax=Cylicocyclus nassatus TaxID=53992 RepID=A0AA36GCC7_CYLNA|nr:unnamed protein product [Cylicocyclus nassatus]